MISYVMRLLAAILIMLPSVASVATREPIKLKFAFFSSDNNHLYLAAVKPFVDAVNAEGKGRVEIDVYTSGKLGSDLTKQSQLIRDGVADIAYVVLPYERAAFPDSPIIELPGLYRNGREATQVLTHLVAAGLMRGFKDFFVIGAFASEPENIHTRLPIASLADLKGKIIRTNNQTEFTIIEKLGAASIFLPLNETAEALGSGKIDGAMVPLVPMIEFGIGRVVSNHYILSTSSVPLAVLMNQEKFNSLPDDVRGILRKYSGEWFAENYIRVDESSNALVMTMLKSDAHRSVVFPSKADMKTADAVFKVVVDAYASGHSHNAELVNAARKEIATLRSSNPAGN